MKFTTGTFRTTLVNQGFTLRQKLIFKNISFNIHQIKKFLQYLYKHSVLYTFFRKEEPFFEKLVISVYNRLDDILHCHATDLHYTLPQAQLSKSERNV